MNKVEGSIDWFEFAPVNDLMLVQILPDETSKKTESGIVLQISESVIDDRPNQGVIVSVGPDSKYAVNEVIYWTKNAGYDLHNIRKDENDNSYVLINPESILGKKVKDTRKN